MGVTLTLRSEHARLAIYTGSEAQLCVFHHKATVTLMPMRWDITLSHPFYSLITAYHLTVLLRTLTKTGPFLIIVHRSPFPVGHAAAVLPAFLPAKLSEHGLCSRPPAFFEEKKTEQASTNQDLGIPCFFCTKSLP